MDSGRKKSGPALAALGAVVVGLLVLAGGCSGTGDGGMNGPDGDGAVSFTAQIQPILTATCAGCHSPGGAADLAGIVVQLTEDVSYDLLVNQPSVQQPELTLVVPGDSTASLLYLKVSSDSPPVGERMPRFLPPLSSADLTLIRSWIDEGALNN